LWVFRRLGMCFYLAHNAHTTFELVHGGQQREDLPVLDADVSLTARYCCLQPGGCLLFDV
jgi:hypothetical protein